MFETGARQLRMAMSMATGRRINPRNVERLVGDALATLETFGSPGDDVGQLVDGPFADAATREAFQVQALRRTAKRLAARSPFYRDLFGSTGVDAKRLDLESLADVPLTTKADLLAQPARFVVEGSQPYLATRTTGTTGQPVEIWLSRYEVTLWPALNALSGLLRGELHPDDCMQINLSSRATASQHLNVAIARLVGARARALGIIAPDESLDSLLTGEDAPTLLSTYPTYLAQLVTAARRRGLGPDDFRLRRIDCGGEVLSRALADAAAETFGASVTDNFGMTEALPVSGRVCEQGHLHHDLNAGLVEVIGLDSGRPCAAGELGTVVITPYFPYRECMPVFRYDTRDVVRTLDASRLTCALAGVPGTTRILGKAGDLIRGAGRTVSPREIVEAIEDLPGQCWPARFAISSQPDHIELRVSREAAGDLTPADVERRIRGAIGDVALTCRLVDPPSPQALRRTRADLLEHTFTHQGA